MKISFVTLHPDFVKAYFGFGVFARGQSKGILSFEVVNLRNYAVDKHGSVDARPYGGGDGMVLRAEPLRDVIRSLSEPSHIILTSPSGKLWTQEDAQRLSKLSKPLVFICGRFAGVDQRFIDLYVDEEISIGDFVVSGGELPALLMADSIVRQIPGVLGNEHSASQDSFSDGFAGGLEHPLYTKPRVFEEKTVPTALTSGNHDAIAQWRKEQSRKKTKQLRPDLLT